MPVAEPEWSGAHKGLCLYVARLLQPVWEESIVASVPGAAPSFSCSLPQPSLEVRLHGRLLCLTKMHGQKDALLKILCSSLGTVLELYNEQAVQVALS